MLVIDGSFGEGGGQIIRTSLALSLVTKKPFRAYNVRARRDKPGLRQQHLTAVNAAARVGGAQVDGAAVGARAFAFVPGEVTPGEYLFDVGTAGSTTLVLQTVLPPLMVAREPSVLTFVGGTHNAFDQRLLAAADIATPADLVGKSAVISQKGTLNDFQTREALMRVGLDPDSDLAGYWAGANQAERINNLRLGNGQATVLGPPLSAALVAEGFTDFGDLSEGPPWPGAAMIVARRVYSARLDFVQRFLRGLLAAIHHTKADPAFAQEVLAKYTRVEEPEAVAAAYALYGDRLLERVPYYSLEGLQRAIDFAAETRPAVRRLQPATLVDHTLLQRLESSGYVDGLSR